MVKRSWIILAFIVPGKVFSQYVGIGMPVPVHSTLEVAGMVGSTVAVFGADKNGLSLGADPPSVGFNYINNTGDQTIKAGYAAIMKMEPATGDLIIGNFDNNISGSDFGSITGYQQRILIRQNGHVGMGSINPTFPLTVGTNAAYTGIVQESPDGSSAIGFTTATGRGMVLTWTNTDMNFTTGNGVSRMRLKTTGDLQVLKSMEIKEKLTSNTTGNANLLPLALGKINFDGTILSATPNILVSRLGIGKFQVSIISEPNLYANMNDYLVRVTAEGNAYAFMTNYVIQSNNTILVEIWRPRLFYTENNCSCHTFSYITNLYAEEPGDCNFSLVVNKF